MRALQFSGLRDYVILRKFDDPAPWLARGYTPADPAFMNTHVRAAVRDADARALRKFWEANFLKPFPGHGDRLELQHRLASELSPLLFLVLERALDRPAGIPYALPKRPEPSGPPRLDTEHWVVIEAVDEQDKPVPSVRLELVIAGGEVKSAVTDKATSR